MLKLLETRKLLIVDTIVATRAFVVKNRNSLNSPTNTTEEVKREAMKLLLPVVYTR